MMAQSCYLHTGLFIVQIETKLRAKNLLLPKLKRTVKRWLEMLRTKVTVGD